MRLVYGNSYCQKEVNLKFKFFDDQKKAAEFFVFLRLWCHITTGR